MRDFWKFVIDIRTSNHIPFCCGCRPREASRLEAKTDEAEAKPHEAEAKPHEAEAEAEATTHEAEAEARFISLEAEARPRGLTSLGIARFVKSSKNVLFLRCRILHWRKLAIRSLCLSDIRCQYQNYKHTFYLFSRHYRHRKLNLKIWVQKNAWWQAPHDAKSLATVLIRKHYHNSEYWSYCSHKYIVTLT